MITLNLLLPFVLATMLSASNLDKTRSSFLETVLDSSSSSQKYCKPTGLIQDACCDFETIEQVNFNLWNTLSSLVETPFFRYHKVNLYKECPFWKEDGSCMNRACGVEMTDEEHIPEEWRSAKLGALESDPSVAIPVESPESCSDDPNFCILDEDTDSTAQYVDLLANPERFTGYAGASSSRVWKSIYEENCFTPVKFIDPARSVTEGGSGFAPLGLMSSSSNEQVKGLMMKRSDGWKEEEKRVLESLVAPRDEGDEVCLEKRVFYKVISGLHASISIHICDDYLDQTTGLWSPNLQCFITRIAQHPERLQNVYFTYVLLLRALATSGDQILETLDSTAPLSSTLAPGQRILNVTSGKYMSKDPDDTRENLVKLIEIARGCENTFDETSMFSGVDSLVLKDQFKSHFRNISSIMDCVGCDKCRLWGKLQITGLGTGLKLLFSDSAPSTSSTHASDSPSFDAALKSSKAAKLTRGEVVAFINTMHRFSESLHSVESFRQLWAIRADAEEAELEEKKAAERKQIEELAKAKKVSSSKKVEL